MIVCVVLLVMIGVVLVVLAHSNDDGVLDPFA